jgi:hypothetical protein
MMDVVMLNISFLESLVEIRTSYKLNDIRDKWTSSRRYSADILLP